MQNSMHVAEKEDFLVLVYERKRARDWRTDGGFGVGGGHIVRQIRMLLVWVNGDNPLLIPVGEGVFNRLEESFLQLSFVS